MDGMVGVGRCVIRKKIIKLIRIKMRKESRAMDSQWALEVMHKAPYMTASFIDEDGKRKQYDKEGVEMKYGRME